MNKEQAIALARAKKAEHPDTFTRLRPFHVDGDRWGVLCELTPLLAWIVTDPETFEHDMAAVQAMGRRLRREAV